MNTLNLKIAVGGACIVLLAACAATTGVLSKGDGLYTINVYRGDAAKVKLRAYQHAEKFCAESDKVLQVVKENLRSEAPPSTMSVIDLDFKCVVGPAPAKK